MEARAEPMPFPAPPRWRRWCRSRGLRALVLVALASLLLVHGIEGLGGAAGVRERFGPTAGLVLVPVQVLVAVSPVPGELVAAISVAIYGFWLGAALCWLGWFGAAFLEYGLVRFTAREVGDPGALDHLPAFLRRLPADHPAFLILTRFLPFGAHVVNVTAGLKRVSLWRFAWTSALSLVPSSLVFSAITLGLLSLP